jgi:NADH:ubiquinone oxidoreductase subunit E
MGSSCYTRGNARHLEIIRAFLAEKGIEADIEISGELCQNKCTHGPIIAICGKVILNVSTDNIREILEHELALQA